MLCVFQTLTRRSLHCRATLCTPTRPSLPTGLALAAVMGAAMAFGIGANDAANSWGTTVGSGVRLERGVPRREVQGL